MKIVCNRIDSKSLTGSIVLVPTSSDDLYLLSSVIAEGDDAEAVTTRKLSMDGGRSQQKIVVKLMVRAETLSFDLEDGIMSIKGRVSKENEHIQQGVYHTLNISLGDKFELHKKKWTRHQQKQLIEATKEMPTICFVIFFEKECVVSTVTSNDIKSVYKGEVKSKNYKPIIASIAGIKDKMKVLIVASFSSAGDEFFKTLAKEHKGIEKQTSAIRLPVEYKNISNTKVISRIMTDKRYAKAFSEVKYVDDLREIEEFFLGITMGSTMTCIGLHEIKEAFEYGAIKVLFVTDALYRPRTVAERESIERVVSQASDLRARICVIPVVHEHGEKLKSMGGIAGLLLFSYK